MDKRPVCYVVSGPELSAHPEFHWDQDAGMGWLHIPQEQDRETYDQHYFDKYVGYADTQMGRNLRRFRLSTLRHHHQAGDRVLDFGIGCGDFVQACRDEQINCEGHDVSAVALAWLDRKGWGRSPGPHDIVTFWDSLEHAVAPADELKQAGRIAIVSLPICETRADWLASKHFRPDEHRWYWSFRGFQRFARDNGFDPIEWSDQETRLGRDSIQTFVLRRRIDG